MTDYYLNEMMQITLILMLERFFYDKRYKVVDKVRTKYFSVLFVDHSIYIYCMFCIVSSVECFLLFILNQQIMFRVFGRKQILISKMSTRAHLMSENIFGMV